MNETFLKFSVTASQHLLCKTTFKVRSCFQEKVTGMKLNMLFHHFVLKSSQFRISIDKNQSRESQH